MALSVSAPTSELEADLADLPSDVRVVRWDFFAEPPLADIDIVVLPYLTDLRPLGVLDRVTSRLVQSPAIGFDGLAELLPGGVTYANGASVHETATAEMTVALVLAAQREMPRMLADQSNGEWSREDRFVPGLADRRVLVIGHGGVGKRIVERLKPFEASITIVARSTAVRGDGLEVRPIDELDALLPEADVVIVAVPLTPQTEGLVDRRFLARLPDGSLVVNVSRGAVADTDAVLDEIGRLRFALDVTDPEPLPAGHPLWNAEGVIITPHAAAGSAAMRPRMAALVRRQVERMRAGLEPINVVIRT